MRGILGEPFVCQGAWISQKKKSAGIAFVFAWRHLCVQTSVFRICWSNCSTQKPLAVLSAEVAKQKKKSGDALKAAERKTVDSSLKILKQIEKARKKGAEL